MYVKKCVSLCLLVILTLTTVFSSNAVEINENDEKQSMEFYKESSQLVKENWNDNYFNCIELEVGKDYLTVDDTDKKIQMSQKVYTKDGQVMVPINEIMDISGGEIDKNKKNIQIEYQGNEIQLKEGTAQMKVNDKPKNIISNTTVNNDNVVVPIDVLSKGMGYECEYNKEINKIQITSPYQTMRLIVKLKNSNSNLEKYKATKIVKGLNNIAILQFDSIENAKSACEQIEKDKIAIYVEPDYYVNGSSLTKTDASASNYSWGTKYIEADKFASYLENKNFKNTVTVGLVDTGVDYNHPFLKNRIKSGGYDFVNDDNDPYDDEGHGTHVSGIIVDCTKNLPIKILPIKVLDSNSEGTTIDIVKGLEYAADNGVDVINFSINMFNHSNYIHEIMKEVLSKNVAVVVSAGNNDRDTVKYECPSDMKELIVVSAIDPQGKKCDFSSYGSTVDVSAPGEYVYSTYPENSYMYMSGTSMATPHVTASVAMYKLENSSRTPSQLEELVKKNTKDLGAVGFDKYYGYGVPKLSMEYLKTFKTFMAYTPSSVSTYISGYGEKSATVKVYRNNKQIGKTIKTSSKSGYYKIDVPKLSGGEKITLKMSKLEYKTKEITKTVNKIFTSKFTVSKTYASSTSLKGYGSKSSTIKAYVNNKQIGKTVKASSKSGYYKIYIPKQKANTKITLTMSKTGYKTKKISTKVKK